MHLAEGPQIDGGVLAAILAAFILTVVLYVVAVVLGFKAAARFGRGGESRHAAMWTIAVVVQLGLGLLGGPNPLLLLGVFLTAMQAIVYARAKGAPPAP